MRKYIVLSLLLITSVAIVFMIFNSKNLEKPLYEKVTLATLKKQIKSNDTLTVYIYKTSCPACQQMKPILNKIIKEKNINIKALNTEENGNYDLSYFKDNKISKTPTIIHYKNGKEVSRIEGFHSEKETAEFLMKK
ncbi:putative bacteriocin transport accessory protein [Laceyella sacchari]|jgi:thioredoxin 1|uniref:thioredoxin family protein n=1 Tax=Laceyella sacchari TaxID=37482 RepID=UPI0010500F7C|nr:thioredoxin family protein [Laceyella sacchari]TCW40591.1 putative bacteriocin transport accessory protein [Laceyella sacchari]